MTWQDFLTDPKPLLKNCDMILNLAGKNIADKRWSTSIKQEILKSRINTTANLANACALLGTQSPMLFNASAVGIYPLQKKVSLSESGYTESSPLNSSAESFLAQVVQQWEAQTNIAQMQGVPVTHLRFAPIIGADSHIINKMWLPFKLGLGGPIGSGNQPFSWVHIDDVIKIIDYLLDNKITGTVNIVAPNTISQKQFARTLARLLHRPAALTMPELVVKFLFGEMGNELLLQGPHVYPQRLLERGYAFEHSEINSALTEIIHKKTT